MSALRARMKAGQPPLCLNGAILVPEHPQYWEVPAAYAEAVQNLVDGGVIEYEPAFVRAPVAAAPVAGMESVKRADPVTPAEKFSRKGRR